MSLEDLKQLGYGGAHQNTRLPRILAELQGLQISFLAGAAANANHVDAAGPDLQDTILKALIQEDTSGILTDVTATQLINDIRPQQTFTVTGASVVSGTTTCVINGKTYTAKNVSPTPTDRGLGQREFATGWSAGTTVLTADQIQALGLSLPPPNGFGLSVQLSRAQCVTLAAGLNGPICALSLANVVNLNDPPLLSASVPAALTSSVCTVYADAENTLGNSITTVGGTGIAAGNTTLLGGLWGLPNGTATVSSTGAAAADTVVLGGVTYTAIAAATSVTGTNQWRAILAADVLTHGVNALVEQGLSAGVASTIASAATNAAAIQTQAALLALAINKNQGATATATYTGTSGVVTIQQVSEGAALTLTKAGTNLAVSASTLTVASRGWKNSASAATSHMLVYWYRKSRLLGQW